ncbi:major facilitator superfamily domain-containing protein [Obelidium mucronatum]|nr:major facilitator superfamily domain-containing protein [Obelidium mucronatum]
MSRRTISFGVSLLLMNCAGTLYLFSSYGQALQQKRQLTQTYLNLIASCGSFGQSLSGPVWGHFSDANDRRNMCTLAGLFIFTGYILLAYGFAYDSIPTFSLPIAYLLVGMGSSGILTVTLSTCSKNFNSRNHGIATGLPMAAFGLSAFLFTMLIQRFFMDEEKAMDYFGFLLCVGMVAGGGAVLGSRFLFDCSLLSNSGGSLVDEDARVATRTVYAENGRISEDDGGGLRENENAQLLARSRRGSRSTVAAGTLGNTDARPLYLKKEAWILFLSFLIVSGCGLMYINNLGAVVIAMTVDSSESIQGIQQYHVGLLSICNCMGRFVNAFTSDFLSARFRVSRIWGFLFGVGLVGLGYGIGTSIDTVVADTLSGLVRITILIGVGYGFVFGSITALITNWFGVEKSGSHIGMFQFGPAIGGYIFNLLFGVYMDVAKKGETECRGSNCFQDAFRACFASCGLVVILLCGWQCSFLVMQTN